MLSEVQIERYCRQIILPEVGSIGQEQLLRSSVSLHGDGDAAFLCASYLAGAGVGKIAPSGFTRPGPRARAFGVDDATGFVDAIARRNPDCRITSEAPDATLVIAIDGAYPAELSPGSALLWGSASDGTVHLARFAPEHACLECLRSLPRHATPIEDAGALGTLAALDALRILLGLAPLVGKALVSIDLTRGTTANAAFPSRPGCRCSSQGELE